MTDLDKAAREYVQSEQWMSKECTYISTSFKAGAEWQAKETEQLLAELRALVPDAKYPGIGLKLAVKERDRYRDTLQQIVDEGIDTSTDSGMAFVREALKKEWE